MEMLDKVDKLNKLSKEIHERNVKVGWWNDDKEGNLPCIYEKLQLISTEIAEATEGERKNLMDDKLPHRKMGEVELADALIRTLDVGGRLGMEFLDLSGRLFFDEMITPLREARTVGHQHLLLNVHLIEFSMNETGHWCNYYYSDLVASIIYVAELNKYDIWGAMEEKIEFNRTRPDHVLENREKEGGKAF